MRWVYDCIVRQHDYRLVALAVALCALACLTSVHVLARGRHRAVWTAGTALAFGTGIWTTHFVAMLAFDPGLPTAYAPGVTALSLLTAILLSVPGFFVLERAAGPGGRALAALLVTLAVAAMHYLGMSAMLVQGAVGYRPGLVLASVAVGLGLTFAAFTAFAAGRRKLAGWLLVPAVCGLHFLGMAAVLIVPAAGPDGIGMGIPAVYLALAVAAVGALSLGFALFAAVIDRRFADRAAQEAERIREFANAAAKGILFLRGGVIVDANDLLCRLSERRLEDIVGQPAGSLFAADAAFWLRTGARGSHETELWTGPGDGRPVELVRRDMGAPGAADAVLYVRDLADRRNAERRIERLAHYDPLTGLANRTLFQDRLGQALALGERSGAGVALLCLDLDRFKLVNDTLGHPAGDRLLIEVAARLTRVLREMDTAARVGGDEFAVIQQIVHQPDAAAALAERLIRELTLPYDLDGQHVIAGVSIGIALFPESATDSAGLMKNADLALYRAKHDGRGVFRFFEQEMDTRMQQRRAIELDLRDAFSGGDLELHYQPLCDAHSMKIIGHEALLRWTHAERGRVAPVEFIPVAEETGLIIPIGRWVIETACAMAATWTEPLRIAVNLSPVQFRDANLVEFVAEVLHRHAIAPDRLELEITEGVLIDHTDRVRKVLVELKRIGVRIVLDDFGTGYSSLSYLQRFPFDKIKIDRSFVHNLGADREADSLVSSIIALGRSLQLEVTAEGVETEQQQNQLRAMQCDQLQGYLIGRPTAQTYSQPARDTAGLAA